MSLPPALLKLLVPHGLTSLVDWSAAAGVPVDSVYQARHGRVLPEKHLVRLALAIGESPSTVRRALCAGSAGDKRRTR